MDNCILSLAQQIATIIPAYSPIDMVCYVKNMDIADIKVRMEVEIKLKVYPYNKYGNVKRKVKYIGACSHKPLQNLGNALKYKYEINTKTV